MVAQLDRGSISETDFGRVIGLNKLKASQIPGAQGGPVTPEVASRHQCPSRIGRKNRGNADPILVATALDAIAKSEETLLIEDWQIVTDDEGVKKKASESDLRTVTSAEFNKLVGGTATGNGSN